MPSKSTNKNGGNTHGRKVPTYLRESILQGDVLFVIGSGVSRASAAKDVECVSWSGLVQDGLEWCCQHHLFDKLASNAQRPLEDYVRALAESGDAECLIAAASELERLLGGRDSGEFGNWLEHSIGQVKAENDAILKALRDLERLGVRLATTNYDGLLEQVTGLRAVTWQNIHQASVEKIVRGKERGIVHIHGYWSEPESVVFSAESYEQLKKDLHIKAILEAVQTLKTVVFIGCGRGGISDPNFSRLMDFSRAVLKRSHYRRYFLCIEQECRELWGILQDTGIKPVVYGNDHDHLEAFIRDLHPGQEVAPFWRGFSSGSKKVTIVPSQLETEIPSKKQAEDSVFTYSNSTEEMDLVKQLEDKALRWFGFDTKQFLGAHIPRSWRTQDSRDVGEAVLEWQCSLEADEEELRGRSLIVLGSPQCNRVSNSIAEEIWSRLDPKKRPPPGKLRYRWELLRDIGDSFLQGAGAKNQPVPTIRGLPSVAEKRQRRLRKKTTWAVVIRTVTSIRSKKETDGGRSGGSRRDRHPVILAGGETAEATYASLCDESQRIISEVLEQEHIAGDFAAVFLVKVAQAKKQPCVDSIRLVAFLYPQLGGDHFVDCSAQDWQKVDPENWTTGAAR